MHKSRSLILKLLLLSLRLAPTYELLDLRLRLEGRSQEVQHSDSKIAIAIRTSVLEQQTGESILDQALQPHTEQNGRLQLSTAVARAQGARFRAVIQILAQYPYL